MLRPDRIAIAPADAGEDLPPARIGGTVRQRLYQGSHFEYVVAIDGDDDACGCSHAQRSRKGRPCCWGSTAQIASWSEWRGQGLRA